MGNSEFCLIHTCIPMPKSPITLDSVFEKCDIDCHIAEASLAGCILGGTVDYGAQDGWLTAGTQSFFLTKLSLVINSPSPLPLAAASFQLNAHLPISYKLFLIKTTHKFPSRNSHGKKGNPFIHNRISRVNCLNHTCLAAL